MGRARRPRRGLGRAPPGVRAVGRAAVRQNGRLRLGAGVGCRRAVAGWLRRVGGRLAWRRRPSARLGVWRPRPAREARLRCRRAAVRRTQAATRAGDRTPRGSVARDGRKPGRDGSAPAGPPAAPPGQTCRAWCVPWPGWRSRPGCAGRCSLPPCMRAAAVRHGRGAAGAAGGARFGAAAEGEVGIASGVAAAQQTGAGLGRVVCRRCDAGVRGGGGKGGGDLGHRRSWCPESQRFLLHQNALPAP